MNKLFIIIMISFLGISSFAQERFYSLYDGWCINKVFYLDSQYLSLGTQTHPTTEGNIEQFNEIYLDGIQTDSYVYLNDTIDGLHGRKSGSYLIKNNKLLFVGAIIDYFKSYNFTSAFVIYDMQSRTADTIITYDVENAGSIINYLIDSIDSGYIIAGDYDYAASNSFPILLFTDENGDTLSTKRYEFLPTNPIRRRVFPYQLLKLPDGGFLLSCQDEIGYFNYHGEIQRTCFLRLDNNGDELWRRYTTTQDTITVHPFAALMPDGDYLIAWSDPWLAESTNPNTCIWLARMTDEGVIYGKKKVSEDIVGLENKRHQINDSYQDENGNVYLAGEKGGLPYTGFLLKIDSLGAAIWYREYECFPENDATYSYSRVYGLTPTEDGGFIMGGEYYSVPGSLFPEGTQQGLVIKVDSMGCLVEGCEYTNVKHTINALNAEIFPNPATDKITISLPEETNNARLKVYDIKGCLWMDFDVNTNNETIDVSSLPAGMYTTNIWANGKLFTGKFVKE